MVEGCTFPFTLTRPSWRWEKETREKFTQKHYKYARVHLPSFMIYLDENFGLSSRPLSAYDACNVCEEKRVNYSNRKWRDTRKCTCTMPKANKLHNHKPCHAIRRKLHLFTREGNLLQWALPLSSPPWRLLCFRVEEPHYEGEAGRGTTQRKFRRQEERGTRNAKCLAYVCTWG
jgi:hypothetical protein